MSAPRIDDQREGEKFMSMILPPYLRKSPKVESLLPVLYLKGLSTNAFKSALTEFLGEGTLGLSPASIVKLKNIWEQEFKVWSKVKGVLPVGREKAMLFGKPLMLREEALLELLVSY